MKALFIGSDPALFDTTSAAFARISSYAKEIGTVHVMMRSAQARDTITSGNVSVHSIVVGKLSLGEFAKQAHAFIEQEGIDIVSAQDPFEHGWIAKKAVQGTRAKLHIQIHTDFLSPWFTRGSIFRSAKVLMPVKNTLRLRIADRVLPHADGIRVVSKRIEDSLIQKYGTKIVAPVVIPIAVQHTLPAKIPFPFQPLPFTLVTVGRIEPEKRMDDLIDAVAHVTERYPMVGLVIIGEGRESARLEKKVGDMGLSEKITFLGARTDAWGLMQSAQGYIQASAYEGYGVTFIEAALARIPIITTDVGIIGEVFSGYEDVLACPPGDATNLGFQIIALIEDVASREVMIRRAEVKAHVHLAQFGDIPKLIARDLAQTVRSTRAL